jgi:hypothetical protein
MSKAYPVRGNEDWRAAAAMDAAALERTGTAVQEPDAAP